MQLSDGFMLIVFLIIMGVAFTGGLILFPVYLEWKKERVVAG